MKLVLRTASTAAVLAIVATLTSSAQTIYGNGSSTTGAHPGYTFAFVDNSDVRSMQGSWQGTGSLFRYIHAHKGTYIAFEQNGTVYRLDTPEQLAEVKRFSAPMRALEAEQQAFAQVQKPLARQQQSLSRRQRAANDADEKGRIGTTQGAIGEEQGEIGSLQGQVGQQQGELGRRLYEHMQTVFGNCIADGTCNRVS